MLEYFSYKKLKKSKEAKKAKEDEATKQVESSQGQDANNADNADNPAPVRQETGLAATDVRPSTDSTPAVGRPVLDRSDESFLQSILSEDGPAPPLPPRVTMPELDWPSDDASSVRRSRSMEESAAPPVAVGDKGESKEASTKKSNRFSQVFSRVGKKKSKNGEMLKPDDAKLADPEEVDKETRDLTKVLDRLNLSASGNNKVIALTEDSAEVLRKFTQVFKDLANGVPTAYDDLVNLIKDRDSAITKGFEKLPSGLKKLVMQLPDKITANIAPEVLAAAAKSQGVEATEHLLAPQNLFKLLTEPGALVGMLRAIVTTLQQRWPAFIGVNVLWSVALALLMFVLWYCYKRGREERLDKEKQDGEAAESEGSEQLYAQSPEVVSPEAASPAVASPDAVSQNHLLEAPPSADSPTTATGPHDTLK